MNEPKQFNADDYAKLAERLKELSAAATPGLWGAEPKRLTIPLSNGETAQGPIMSYLSGNHASPDGMKVSLGSERHADHYFVVALVNAFRSGALIVSESATNVPPIEVVSALRWTLENFEASLAGKVIVNADEVIVHAKRILEKWVVE